MIALTGNQVLTDEILSPCLLEVERIFTNRPMVPLSFDARDQSPMRPNKLRLLRDANGQPDSGGVEGKYARRWTQVKHLANIWRLWLKEYLPNLHSRQKWLSKRCNFKKCDVIPITTETKNRGQWSLGMMESCQVDDNGLVRTVNVCTANGVPHGDIGRLYLLEGVE